MTHEEEVRSVWEKVDLTGRDDHWSTLPFGVIGLSGPCATEAKAWAAAAEFTRERLEQVRQLRSEADRNSQHVAALHSELDYAVREGLAALARVAAKNICTDSRTLARLEAELTRLTAGMKPEPQQ